jgi:Uma2 family endonuclease
MPSQKNPHMLAITKGAAELGRHFPLPSYWLVIQGTLRLDEHNAPDPDFFIAPGPVDQGKEAISPHLVIEVSDTTLLYDQLVKGSLYASHRITDYWVVNVNDRQVEVYREPTPDESRQYGWRYGRVDVVRPPALLTPLFKPQVSIEAAALLP